MKALIMGGTTFFGKRLVTQLRDEGCDVTIATRGRIPDEFGDRVTRVRFERTSFASMEAVFLASRFDVVFDQIGYAPDDVEDACRVFAGKTGHYVFTSSNAVYSIPCSRLTEDAFDPMSIAPGRGRMTELGYADGKRRAEAYLFQHAPFPVAAARFPVVLGPDDPSDRFQFHVGRVLQGKPIVVGKPCGHMNYIGAEDAGRFLRWLGATGRVGPYNGACSHAIDAAEMVERIAQVLGRAPQLATRGREQDQSPFCLPEGDWTIDMAKAERDGFRFTPFDEWFPETVHATARRLDAREDMSGRSPLWPLSADEIQPMRKVRRQHAARALELNGSNLMATSKGLGVAVNTLRSYLGRS